MRECCICRDAGVDDLLKQALCFQPARRSEAGSEYGAADQPPSNWNELSTRGRMPEYASTPEKVTNRGFHVWYAMIQYAVRHRGRLSDPRVASRPHVPAI